ncbi:uncharacterized protein LOC134694487 [Mytilus trossulus]|uniref:uncharacterized protein LOC134694487 n=1 Tax=Mytilus trossulus TaxID=6551 RepID=UPI0030054B6D
MKMIFFGFLVCVLVFSVKSETQNVEYDKIRDLVREEIQNFHDSKILKLEQKVMKMNEQLNRQEEHIQSQTTLIEEQQSYIKVQEIQIQTHEKQINEAVEHISKLEGNAVNEVKQTQSVGVSTIKPWIHTDARDVGNISSHSLKHHALRQPVKSMPENTGNRKERHSLKKRLGLNDNIVAFYAYLSHGESQPGKHQILVFDVVKTNVGLSFNKYSGMFTAPVNGVYAFIWTVSSGTYSYIYSQLVVNSDPFGAIATDSDEINDYHTVTGSVVAELNHGDVVYIRTHPTFGIKGVIRSQDEMRTSFSGWKL